MTTIPGGTMKAVVLDSVGPPNVLQAKTVRSPVVGENEVLVRVRAAGVNRRDLHLRSGKENCTLPFVPGSDGAGIIVAKGAAVERVTLDTQVVIYPVLNWGTKVPAAPIAILGGPRDGTYAEYVAVPQENVFPKPAALTWAESSTLSVTGLAAWRGLKTRGNLRQGERLLIREVGSGMTTFALKLALDLGAEVSVSARTEARLEKALREGAHSGFVESGTGESDRDAPLVDGAGFDLIVDATGRWHRSLRTLVPGGRLLAFGGSAVTLDGLSPGSVTQNGLSVLGVAMGSRDDFRDLLAHVQAHHTRPVIDSSLALEQVAQAHDRIERKQHFGKVTLAV